MSENVTTSEPTTGEIVRALRCAQKVHAESAVCGLAADCLESQEREIERLNEELQQTEEAATVLHNANETHWTYIKELTARAEQAEAREDAMIDFMYAYCQFCEHRDAGEEEEPCCSCENVTHDGRECKWQLLRLPQEGE